MEPYILPRMQFNCPDDRGLKIRSWMNIGWCYRSKQITYSSTRKVEPFTESELETFNKAAEQHQLWQQNQTEIVIKLKKYLDDMEKALPNLGPNCCQFCGKNAYFLLLLKPSFAICQGCDRVVCIDCTKKIWRNEEMIVRCILCMEARRLLMIAGSWLTKGLLPHVLYEERFFPHERKYYNFRKSGYVPTYINLGVPRIDYIETEDKITSKSLEKLNMKLEQTKSQPVSTKQKTRPLQNKFQSVRKMISSYMAFTNGSVIERPVPPSPYHFYNKPGVLKIDHDSDGEITPAMLEGQPGTSQKMSSEQPSRYESLVENPSPYKQPTNLQEFQNRLAVNNHFTRREF